MQQELSDLLLSEDLDDIKLGLTIARKENIPFGELDKVYSAILTPFRAPDALRKRPHEIMNAIRKSDVWKQYLIFHSHDIQYNSDKGVGVTKYFSSWHNHI